MCELRSVLGSKPDLPTPSSVVTAKLQDLAVSSYKLKLATRSDNSRISVLSIWKLFPSLPPGWVHVSQRGAVYYTIIRGPRSFLSSTCGFHVS